MLLIHFLAKSGILSRRKAEEVIKYKLVTVNGKMVKLPNFEIDEKKDQVIYDDKIVSLPNFFYIMLNKPEACITSKLDKSKRSIVYDYLPEDIRASADAVGRLDYNTSGILFFSNDGEFVHALSHPKFKIEKTYSIQVSRDLDQDHIKTLIKGIRVDDYTFIKPDKVEWNKKHPRNLTITLHSGKNRVIRNMIEQIGAFVKKLHRISCARIKLGKLKFGELRYLTKKEIIFLKNQGNPPLVKEGTVVEKEESSLIRVDGVKGKVSRRNNARYNNSVGAGSFKKDNLSDELQARPTGIRMIKADSIFSQKPDKDSGSFPKIKKSTLKKDNFSTNDLDAKPIVKSRKEVKQDNFSTKKEDWAAKPITAGKRNFKEDTFQKNSFPVKPFKKGSSFIKKDDAKLKEDGWELATKKNKFFEDSNSFDNKESKPRRNSSFDKEDKFSDKPARKNSSFVKKDDWETKPVRRKNSFVRKSNKDSNDADSFDDWGTKPKRNSSFGEDDDFSEKPQRSNFSRGPKKDNFRSDSKKDNFKSKSPRKGKPAGKFGKPPKSKNKSFINKKK